MEEKYKFFSAKYNKILDLIDKVDSNLAGQYVKVMSRLPNAVVKKLQNQYKFKSFSTLYQSDLNFYDEMLEFDYTQYNKYYDVAIKIYPIFEEEISDEFDDNVEEFEDMIGGDLQEMNQWFIFSLTISNVKGVAKLKLNYEERDGKLVYVGGEMNGIEIEYEVFAEKRNEDYFIIITKYLNGHESERKEIPIELDELIKYSSTWDDLEFDEEINNEDEFNC